MEHSHRVIKFQVGYPTVRCWGLAKNIAQTITIFSLSNLWLVRKLWRANAQANTVYLAETNLRISCKDAEKNFKYLCKRTTAE